MDEILELLDSIKESVQVMKKGAESALAMVKAGDTEEAQEMLETLLGQGPEEADDDDEDAD